MKFFCTFHSVALSRSLLSFLPIPSTKALNPKIWVQKFTALWTATLSYKPLTDMGDWIAIFTKQQKHQSCNRTCDLWTSHPQMIRQAFPLPFYIRSITSWWNNDPNCDSSCDNYRKWRSQCIIANSTAVSVLSVGVFPSFQKLSITQWIITALLLFPTQWNYLNWNPCDHCFISVFWTNAVWKG